MNTYEYCRILKGTATLEEGTNNLVINLQNTCTITNGDIFRFCITNSFDKTTNPLGTVSVVVNGQSFALKTKFGNDIRIDQLFARKAYTVGIGAQTPTMVVLNCIPATSFAYPTYSA